MALAHEPSPTEPASRLAPPTPEAGFGRSRLAWLAVGTFAVGTENLAVGAMLVLIADDVGTTVAQAGLLVSAFALVYAVAAPLMGAASSRRAPNRVLVAALVGLAVIDVAAAAAPSFGWLLLGRTLAAVAAATYTPNALALAGSVVGPHERGRATAIVYGGLAAATLVGVPLAALAANTIGWRITFATVGVLAAVAALGVATRLPAAPRRHPVQLADWITVLRIGDARRTLLVTFMVYTGQFAAFAFVAPIVNAITRSDCGWVAYAMLAFGLAAVIGNPIGGRLTDQIGPDRVASVAQLLTATGLASLSAIGWILTDGALIITSLAIVMAVWGLGAWSFNPPQQVRLLTAGRELGPLALAANSTALYAGIAAGGVLGAAVVSLVGTNAAGLAGALTVLAALGVDRRTSRQRETDTIR